METKTGAVGTRRFELRRSLSNDIGRVNGVSARESAMRAIDRPHGIVPERVFFRLNVKIVWRMYTGWWCSSFDAAKNIAVVYFSPACVGWSFFGVFLDLTCMHYNELWEGSQYTVSTRFTVVLLRHFYCACLPSGTATDMAAMGWDVGCVDIRYANPRSRGHSDAQVVMVLNKPATWSVFVYMYVYTFPYLWIHPLHKLYTLPDKYIALIVCNHCWGHITDDTSCGSTGSSIQERGTFVERISLYSLQQQGRDVFCFGEALYVSKRLADFIQPWSCSVRKQSFIFPSIPISLIRDELRTKTSQKCDAIGFASLLVGDLSNTICGTCLAQVYMSPEKPTDLKWYSTL